jgi:hypothetical protein
VVRSRFDGRFVVVDIVAIVAAFVKYSCRATGCIFGEFLLKAPLLPGKTELEQLDKIMKLVGPPSEAGWPGVASLPGFSSLKTSEYGPGALSSMFSHLSSNVRRLGLAPFLVSSGMPGCLCSSGPRSFARTSHI